MPLAADDTVRFVTNDFMYTGGDGYTVFTQGTDVLQKGDLLLDVVAAYIEAARAGRAGRGGSDHRPVVPRSSQRSKGRLGEPALSCHCNGVRAHRRLRHAAAEPHRCTQERPLSRKCMG